MQLGYIQGNDKYKQRCILISYCLLCTEEFRDTNGHCMIWSGFLQTQDHQHSFTKAMVRNNTLVMLLMQSNIAFASPIISTQTPICNESNQRYMPFTGLYFSHKQGDRKVKGPGHQHSQNTPISTGCHAVSCVN